MDTLGWVLWGIGLVGFIPTLISASKGKLVLGIETVSVFLMLVGIAIVILSKVS